MCMWVYTNKYTCAYNHTYSSHYTLNLSSCLSSKNCQQPLADSTRHLQRLRHRCCFFPLFARSLSFSISFAQCCSNRPTPAFVSKSWWNCPMVYSWSSGLDFEIRAGHGDVCIPLVSSEWVQETTLINGQDCAGLSTDLPFQPISRFRRISNGWIGWMGTLNWPAIWRKDRNKVATEQQMHK